MHESGLSFSTEYRSGSGETTLNTINGTGVLYAIKDGRTHVSVYPVGATLEEWQKQGVNSIYTQTLQAHITLK